MKTRFGLNSNLLKFLALISMTVDHIGFVLFPHVAILRIFGRLAYPIFAYFIAEGCKYTKHKLRYFFMMFGLGMACQIVYTLFVGDYYLGILLTYSLSILIIYGVQFIKKQWQSERSPFKLVLGSLWILSATFVAALLCYPPERLSAAFPNLFLDYSFFGVLTPVLIFLMPNKRLKLLALAVGIVLIAFDPALPEPYPGLPDPTVLELHALVSLIPLAFYNGQRGRVNLKYLFYLYYPLHIAAIYAIYYFS